MTVRSLSVFVLRRIAVLVLLVILLSFVVFSLLYVAPGDEVSSLLGTSPRTPETVHVLREKYHLDKPFLTQYWIWASHAARADFGSSSETSLPVTDELKARLPTSLYLGLYSYLLTVVLGVGLGTAAAFRRRSAVDRGIVGAGMVALSIPAFVAGIFLIYIFGIVLPWFPVAGGGQGFTDQLNHLTLPALALALGAIAYVLKHTRAAVIGVLDQDYVTFARARGLSGRRIMLGYVVRTALIPIITISGLLLSYLITGAVLIEMTFSLPGIGRLLVQSATAQDLPMIQGVALLIAVVVMVINLLTDIIYVIVDPRIQLGRQTA